MGSYFSKQLSFWWENCLKKDIYRRATFSKHVLLHSINCFRKVACWKKLIIQKSNTLCYLLFLESCFFTAATFSKDATFYSIYLFRRAASWQDTFSEELIFHSYTCFLQLHYFFICLVINWALVNVQFKYESSLCIYYCSNRIIDV